MKKVCRKCFASFLALTLVPMTGIMNVPVRAADDSSDNATIVKLSPSNASRFNNGIFEGWGTSLCWWANRIGLTFGDNESDEKEEALAQEAAKAFFSEEGLGLDIARYNIGGGDDPSHDHIIRSDSAIEGFATGYDENGDLVYDWTADQRQRHILDLALQQNPDLYVEGFSNSPPYFMTKSGCSSGAINASENNLQEDKYDDFAEYVATVTDHFKNEWGISFKSVSPMNEPDTSYWGANSNKQEGCHFDSGISESTMINEMRAALDGHGLRDIIVAGMDETSIDSTVTNLGELDTDAQANLGRIDTHTYSGSNRTGLKSKAESMGKNLWMSEVDGTFSTGSSMKRGLGFANRIITDVNGMMPSAWIMWQAIDRHISDYYKTDGSNTIDESNSEMPSEDSGYWGLAIANHYTGKIQYTKKYYAFGQFSKYIKPGDTIIGSSANTLAAYNRNTGKIVIVAINSDSSDSAYTFDLSDFTKVGSRAEVIRTSGEFTYDANGNATDQGESWTKLSDIEIIDKQLDTVLKANSITTFVVEPTNEQIHYLSIQGNNIASVGKEQQYTILTDLNNTDVVWSVNDSNIAEVTQNGILMPKAEGTVTISATIGDYTANIVVQCLPWQEITLNSSMVSGTAPWNNSSNTYLKTIDNDVSTFFDGVADGYVQFDLGAKYTIGGFGYAPRGGFEYRMRDGFFAGSNDGTNWTTIYTITSSPPASELTRVFSDEFDEGYDTTQSFRYIRYTVPDSTHTQTYNGSSEAYNCNVSEIKIYGSQSSMDLLESIVDDVAPDSEIRTNQYMPTEYDGAQIQWSTSDPSISKEGIITRGTEDKNVDITAIISKGSDELTKIYSCTVKARAIGKSEEDMDAYLFVHFAGTESTADDEQIYFSVSKDGQTWHTLNNKSPILTSILGEKGVRDPHIIRSPEGDKFFIVATDLSIYNRQDDSNRWSTCQTSGSKAIMIWESTDLINWSAERMVKVADSNAGCTWAPESVYDDQKGAYMIFWASKVSDDQYTNQRIYRSYTRDFEHFTDPEIYIDDATEEDIANGTNASNIDTTFLKHNGTYYRFTKNESNSSVTMMKGDSLNGEFDEVETYTLNNVPGNTITGYEGPTVYKLNGEDKWSLLLDHYSQSEGYKPFVTNDIATGAFTSADDFSFDMTYRHGTVLPITIEEYKSLVSAYGSATIIGKDHVKVENAEEYFVEMNGEEAEVQWSVSDESIATIDSNGTLHGIKPGKVTITAYASDYDITIKKEVEVAKYSVINLSSSMVSGTAAWNDDTTNTYVKTIDNDLSTYFDGVTKGYIMFDFGQKYSIQAIGYAPRAGYEYRLKDGYFSGSNDGSNWTKIYTIPNTVTAQANTVTTAEISDHTGYRYIKYTVPDGTHTYNSNGTSEAYNCNIAEIKLYGEEKDDIEYGLVSNISFDETSTGSGSFTATKGGKISEFGTINYEDGKIGKAVSIDYGTGNYLELADGILTGTSTATVSFWLKQDRISNNGWGFMMTPVTSGAQVYKSEKYIGLLLAKEQNLLTAERYYSSSIARPAQVNASGTFSDWTYVTVVYDANKTMIYINGEKISQLESSVDLKNIFSASAKSWIGHGNWGSGEGFSGMIDEFRLYNRSLSDSEIQVLYNLNETEPFININNVTVTGNTVTVDVTKQNVGNADIYLGVYNEDNALIGVSKNSMTVKIDGIPVKVKMFAWEGMKPICKAASAEIKQSFK